MKTCKNCRSQNSYPFIDNTRHWMIFEITFSLRTVDIMVLHISQLYAFCTFLPTGTLNYVFIFLQIRIFETEN